VNTHTTNIINGRGGSAAQIVRTIYSDSDGHNRQFIYTLYADGSAMSREITRHCSDPARRTQCTYRERHDVGSEMAVLINLLASQPSLPAGWYESAA
jgi:hypothetical protein